MLLQRQQRKGFLHRIVTGNEKWIYYENPKSQKTWVKPGEPSPSQAKRNIHCAKAMLCIWWDQRGVVHYELLEPCQTINREFYRRQLMQLKRAIEEKRPEWVNRHSKLILQHDNAKPHTAQVVKKYLDGQDWEVLFYPSYSPDIAPSDYHLFWTIQLYINYLKDGQSSCRWRILWINRCCNCTNIFWQIITNFFCHKRDGIHSHSNCGVQPVQNSNEEKQIVDLIHHLDICEFVYQICQLAEIK